MEELTHKYLLESVRYEPNTGKFYWRDRPRSHFKTNQGYRTWRANCLGKETGSDTGHGYKKICINSISYLAHRLAWFYVHQTWPSEFIDHINGDGSDNRIANLREASHANNQRNMKRSKRNLSGVPGVRLSQWNTWQVSIWKNGRSVWLGSYSSKSEAISVRKSAERKLGYHPNHGRAA